MLSKLPWQPGKLLGQIEKLGKPTIHLWGVLASPHLSKLLPSHYAPPFEPSECSTPPTPGRSLALDWGSHNRQKDTIMGCTWMKPQTSTLQKLDLCKHTSATGFSTPSLWGKSPRVGRRKKTQLQGKQPLESDIQGFRSSNLGTSLTPDRAVMAIEQIGSPASRLSRSSSPISSLTTYQGEGRQHNLRKGMTVPTSKTVPHQSQWVHTVW